MARDNFKKSVIELVNKRVNGRCSNPSCRTPTFAPAAETLAVINVGIAAHICAASPGGPRYSPDMSSKDRGGFENAIWLCSVCATKIDRDVAAFPVDLLLKWKKEAEDQARAELGRRLPAASDAYEQIAMALAGAGPRFLPKAIANVHKATASSLESMDPRFEVQSEFSGGRVRLKLSAREDIPFSLRIGPESAKAWMKGMSSLVDLGRSVTLPMMGVSFEGSKLLESMVGTSDQATLTINPIGKPAVLKFFVPHEEIRTTEDVIGTLSTGKRSLHFEGQGYGGLISVELDLERLLNERFSAGISLVASFASWKGLDVKRPPYLDKVNRLLNCLVNTPEQFSIHLEIEGNHVFTGSKVHEFNRDVFANLLSFVQYVERAKSVAQYLGISLPILCDGVYSAEEHQELANAADIIKGRLRYQRDQFTEEPRLTIVCSDGGKKLESLILAGEFSTLQQSRPGGLIKIFGEEVQLPDVGLYMCPARLHIVSKRAIPGATEFELRVEMGENFVCETAFKVPEASG